MFFTATIFFAGQATAKTIIDIPDDNLFEVTNTTSGSESSAQQSNPDGNEHGSSMCALWSNSSIRYRYVTPSLPLKSKEYVDAEAFNFATLHNSVYIRK